MATKTKTSGATTATATKKAKSKSVIEKPTAQLREPLQKKVDLFEQLGWVIGQNGEKKWIAERLEGDDPWKLGERQTISELLNDMFTIENRHLISDLTSDEELAMLEWRVKGWKFEQDEDQMWSATKGEEYAGKMSDLRPLFSYIEGTETGDHGAAIEKMKVETVASEKKKFEDEGWRFVEVAEPGNSKWFATNDSPAFTEISSESLPVVFDAIRSTQKANAENLEKFFADKLSVQNGEEISGKSKEKHLKWQLPMIQQFTISEYIEKYEVTALYQTDKSIVEVEYKNTETKKATSVFIDELGTEYHERKKIFGKTDLDSVISAEDFFQKFPSFAPKKSVLDFRIDHFKNTFGWTLIENADDTFSGAKKFLHNRYTTRIDGAKSWDELLDAAQEIETKESEILANPSSPIIVNNQQSNSPVVELSIDEISTSEFTPQWHRRRRFKPEDLAELAESIKNQGLINPITVRRVNVRVEPYTAGNWNLFYPEKDGGTTVHCSGASKEQVEALARKASHEIVAGERRFEATKLAGLDKILCFVKDLTDEQALEIQLQENLQRVDVNPLDEAFSYKYLMENQRMTVADLMLKFGKNEKYVTLRLKLNKLIPEVLDLISSEQLPLAHAVEISKFDESQQSEVLKCCFDTVWDPPHGYVSNYDKPFHLKSALKEIASKVLHKLKDAPFPTKDKRLRPDGLICPKCPERTGANDPMSLFDEYREEGTDRCLNPVCYDAKTSRFVQITRDEATAKVKKELNCAADYQIRVLAWNERNKTRLTQIFGVGVLTDGEYRNCTQQPCESAQPGVFLDPGAHRFGDIVQICLDPNCAKHRSSSTATSSIPGEKTDAEKQAFYKRKQEIFDIKIGEPVRKNVLREAAKTFTGERWIFEDEKWRLKLVERLWDQIDGHARTTIAEVLGMKSYKKDLSNLSVDQLSKILFLSIIANEGQMLWGSWSDQKNIVAVAEEFGVDYKLLDAKERAVEAPKKFKEAAYEHLSKIERGEKAERPVFYKLEK